MKKYILAQGDGEKIPYFGYTTLYATNPNMARLLYSRLTGQTINIQIICDF